MHSSRDGCAPQKLWSSSLSGCVGRPGSTARGVVPPLPPKPEARFPLGAWGEVAIPFRLHGLPRTGSHRGRRGERARRAERDPARRGIRDGDGGRRLQGARQARGVQPRRHPHRPQDARPRRDGVHGKGPCRCTGRGLRRDDGVRDDSRRGRRGEARRRELPDQAARARRRGGRRSSGRWRRRGSSTRRARSATGCGSATSRATSSRATRRCRRCWSSWRQVGPSKASVLITGESGTGKELVAEALHAASPAREDAVRAPALRGARRVAPRERALRARARRVHRGRRAPRGALQAGRRRHALPRRDRRDPRRDAGQAPALPPGARRSSGSAATRRCGSTCASSPRRTRTSARRFSKGHVPRRPLLPAQRRRGRAPPAARAARRHPPARRVLPAPATPRRTASRSTGFTDARARPA